MSGLKLSPTQMKFLDHLARSGATRWDEMPTNRRGRALSRATWHPLLDAGLIDAWFDREMPDWMFAITPYGKDALSRIRAEGSA